MPIDRLLQNSKLEPAAQKALRLAFIRALRLLGLVDRNDPVCGIVACKIVEIGATGASDPIAISDIAVRQLSALVPLPPSRLPMPAEPMSLLRAALSTLLDKTRSDGVVEVTKVLAKVCFAEQPFAALARHREVIAFFEKPSLAPLRSIPLANKYLSAYLGKSFGKVSRREILVHHYRRIIESAVPGFFEGVSTSSYLLWSKEDPRGSCAMRLTFNKTDEGELSVVYMRNEQRIFEISFSIVPGCAIGASAKELLFIALVHGANNKFAEIKQATEVCEDVPPQHMLMLAIRSIAQSLGITAVAGVANYNLLNGGNFKFNYDAFWENWVERPTGRHFYEIPIPLPRTELCEIQSDHRRRTRRKRRFKDQVGDSIAASLREVFSQRSDTLT
jgi:uncharacterized protein VirK/YbjX